MIEQFREIQILGGTKIVRCFMPDEFSAWAATGTAYSRPFWDARRIRNGLFNVTHLATGRRLQWKGSLDQCATPPLPLADALRAASIIDSIWGGWGQIRNSDEGVGGTPVGFTGEAIIYSAAACEQLGEAGVYDRAKMTRLAEEFREYGRKTLPNLS